MKVHEKARLPGAASAKDNLVLSGLDATQVVSDLDVNRIMVLVDAEAVPNESNEAS
jgi:hypothetical protein